MAKNYLDSKTIVIILSDGWDTGNIDLLRKSMEFIHAKVKKTYLVKSTWRLCSLST